MKNFPSDYEIDAIEHEAAEEVAADDASLGELEDKVDFDFCKDCPMLGFPQEEIARSSQAIGGSVRYPGTTVSVTVESRDGKVSKKMLLGTHDSNSVGGNRINKIYHDAAKRTQECEEPKRTPSFLGPLAVKKCRAIEKYKD